MKTVTTKRAPEPRFRRKLAEELARRCAQNRQYSLRAFAQFLEIDHSSLSQILRGRRALTERTIRQLAATLGLDEAAIDRFVEVETSSGSDDVRREMEQLTSDTVELLAD